MASGSVSEVRDTNLLFRRGTHRFMSDEWGGLGVVKHPNGLFFPPIHVILSSESSGQLWNTCIWDLKSGTSLHTFRGGISSPHTLTLVKSDYALSAEKDKPLIHYWPISKKESSQSRIVCPGRVAALDITPDGCYCIAAIEEKIHIWQLCTGRLLAVISSHYQAVKCVKVTSEGSHFITGGDDSILYCWSIASVLSPGDSLSAEPRWTWSNHSLPITDVHVGITGSSCRVASVSLDQSCRLWDTFTGEQVAVFMLEKSLTSVCMDQGETTIYIGSSTGVIHGVSLCERVQHTERHIAESNTTVFKGHTMKVECLAVNIDGSILVSGSHDTTVRVWHTESRQCIKTLQHKGAIHNIIITPMLAGLQSHKFKPSLTIKAFARHLYQAHEDEMADIAVHLQNADDSESDLDFAERKMCLSVTSAQIDKFMETGELPRNDNSSVRYTAQSKVNVMKDPTDELTETKCELAKALRANKALYEYTLKATLGQQDT